MAKRQNPTTCREKFLANEFGDTTTAVFRVGACGEGASPSCKAITNSKVWAAIESGKLWKKNQFTGRPNTMNIRKAHPGEKLTYRQLEDISKKSADWHKLSEDPRGQIYIHATHWPTLDANSVIRVTKGTTKSVEQSYDNVARTAEVPRFKAFRCEWEELACVPRSCAHT